MKSNCFSQDISVFHGRRVPEEGCLVGYGAIIDHFNLPVPFPETLAIISFKNRNYRKEGWQVFSPRYRPEDNLYKQLVFALKYEGVNLLVLKKLFDALSVSEAVELVSLEPLGQYSRKLWFLYEWLMDEMLPIKNLSSSNYAPLVDAKLQYVLEEGEKSPRHRIINNLPGTPEFCPLIFKTKKLENYLDNSSGAKREDLIKSIHKDVLQRASAFLLLKDSKASFSIEGESPGTNRALRWGKAIGQAGKFALSKQELLRLQQIVISDTRFTKMGFRESGGFVGEHDRLSGDPIPDHISAKAKDVEKLMAGLMETTQKLEKSNYPPVLAAAAISFGFVFIHPFTDGNGRIHRYIIHHLLARMGFAPQGFIFPVSASILNHIRDYRDALESYSHPLLDFINWKPTNDHNVEVLNDTEDYYKYFDATRQAEFLYDCVQDTIDRIIPEEVLYLQKFDKMKSFLENIVDMPDKMVSLLIRFLEQNEGILSNRALVKEFRALTPAEKIRIEEKYAEIFGAGEAS